GAGLGHAEAVWGPPGGGAPGAGGHVRRDVAGRARAARRAEAPGGAAPAGPGGRPPRPRQRGNPAILDHHIRTQRAAGRHHGAARHREGTRQRWRVRSVWQRTARAGTAAHERDPVPRMAASSRGAPPARPTSRGTMRVATASLSPAPSGSIHSPDRSSTPVRSAAQPGASVPTSPERRIAAAGAAVVAATTSARLIPQCSSFDKVVAWSYTGPPTLWA